MTEAGIEDAPTAASPEAEGGELAADAATDEHPAHGVPPRAADLEPKLPAPPPTGTAGPLPRPHAPIGLDGLAYGIDHLDAIVVYYVGDAHVHAAWVRADAGFGAEDVAVRLRDAYRACQSAVRGIETVSATSPPASTLSDAFVTLETPSRVTFMRRIRAYVVASLFDAAMPLGMARLMAARIAAAVEPELPFGDESSTRSTALPTPSMVPEDTSELEAAKTLAVPGVGRGGDPRRVDTAHPGPLRAGTSKPPPPVRPTLSELDRARRLLVYLEAHAPEPHVARLRVALRAGLTPLALEHPEALGADAIVLIETAVQDILGIDRGELRGLA